MKKTVKSLCLSAVLALCILISTGCAPTISTLTIYGTSMFPTIANGAQVIIEEINAEDVRHNDIVTFKYYNALGAQTDDGGIYDIVIKRVIALGGDKIEFIRQEGAAYFNVFLNNEQLDEYYLNTDSEYGRTILALFVQSQFTQTAQYRYEYTVPANQMFVMGDNRKDSADSRQYGPINISLITGKLAEIIG